MAVLQLLKICEDAKIPTFDLKTHYTFYALEDTVIRSNKAFPVRTGIKMAIPNNFCALIVSNGKYSIGGGLIDSDYRGELMTIIHSATDIKISKGEAIAKMFVLEIGTPEIRYCDDVIIGECNDEETSHPVEN